MRVAVSINAYSTQLRVTNATKLMYQRIFKRTGNTPGGCNLISPQNDEYPLSTLYETDIYCRIGTMPESMQAFVLLMSHVTWGSN